MRVWVLVRSTRAGLSTSRCVRHASGQSAAGAKTKAATSTPAAPPAATASSELSAYSFKPVFPPHMRVVAPGPSSLPATSVRVGAIALKAGMTADYDSWGVRHALTVLKFENVVVLGQILEAVRGYTALVVGAGVGKRPHPYTHAHRAELSGVPALTQAAPAALNFERVCEFRVTPDALLPVGTRLDVRHFVPGQRVAVRGVSQGKGFAGVMKRHGFSGQGASHGNSLNHRTPGSTGCRQWPGRVMPGKPMPGRLGGDRVCVCEGARVYKTDVAKQLVYLQGSVPGRVGSWLTLTDSNLPRYVRAHTDTGPRGVALPFPTHTHTDAHEEQMRRWAAGDLTEPYELVVAPPELDPFAIREDEEPEEV